MAIEGKNRVKLSKFLSLILRHHPREYGLELNKEGFAPLSHVLAVLKKEFPGLSPGDLKRLVRESHPQRFQIRREKIRALYGHSVRVFPSPEPEVPPPLLFHGTSPQNYRKVQSEGLKRMGRQYVHLSRNEEDALRVARRHTDFPIVLEVRAREAVSSGITFYRSGEVYLVEHLPPEFIGRPYLPGKPWMRLALCFVQKENGLVICNLCRRRCRIGIGETGFCRVRKNIKGWLFTQNYGDISSLQMRPIEIKPFYHFYPGSQALTYSSWSCNFGCPWCQNWTLSQKLSDEINYVSPAELVQRAVELGADGICCSFNEPTLLHEYNLDCFRRAKSASLYATYVSNGYMTKEAVQQLVDAGLDAINVDVKGNPATYQHYIPGVEAESVWENVRYFLKKGVWVEVIFLVIPGVNDSEEAVDWVIDRHLEYAGPETPLHVNRYFPANRMRRSPTPLEELEEVSRRARSRGIKYVYIGNTDFDQNTYCPECGSRLIERNIVGVRLVELGNSGVCLQCGAKINLFQKRAGNSR